MLKEIPAFARVPTASAGIIQAFVNPALKRAVASTCSLNFFHQSSKPLSILAKP
jgi:hypothetical protein